MYMQGILTRHKLQGHSCHCINSTKKNTEIITESERGEGGGEAIAFRTLGNNLRT